MFSNNPFEAVTKSLLSGAGTFSTDAAQVAARELMDSLQSWGKLVQSQAQAVQAASMETLEEFKSVRDPMAALQALKASTQRSVALAARHLQESTALSVEQFNAGVDLLQERHPAPDTFEPLAHGMKLTASAIESGILAALHSSVEAAGSAAPAKKSRSR